MSSDKTAHGDLSVRYPELDALRGLAIVCMVIFHLLFDLAYFFVWDIDIWSMGFTLFGRSTAALFLLLCGISFTISWHRTASARRIRKAFRRSAILLFGAGLITAVTYLAFPGKFIIFGILHLLGVSALLQPLLFRMHRWNAAVGLLLVALPSVLPSHCVECSPVLLPLGMHAADFLSLDYYPLIPWMGVVCFGMAIGSAFYVPARTHTLAVFDTLPYPPFLRWAGRRSLLIYFLHQPILLSLLFAGEKLAKTFG